MGLPGHHVWARYAPDPMILRNGTEFYTCQYSRLQIVEISLPAVNVPWAL